MAVRNLQVFLASRFDEFAELRAALRRRIDRVRRPAVMAVDLNDNMPDHEPPLVRCYEAVDQADLIVLLVGDTYGTEVAGNRGSYTHLEYQRAVRDSSKIILPFLVTNGKSPDARLRRWVEEILENHTVSHVDPALGPERMASDIFEALYGRLWEIAAEGETPYDADDDEEGAPAWDESPIKRDELKATLPAAERAAHPLKAMAVDHATEAFEALVVNLPDVAVQQLKKSLEMSPLALVPTYWLARLLIATGRIGDCREGMRLALRCAHVASRRENAPDDLVIMASLILAARARERLEDREGAFLYAEKAHDEKPGHWLAKFELGRQFALKGKTDDAIGYAREAFWLRPDSIHKIDSDPAYRDLGSAFDEFREQLRSKVESEAADILRIELALRELAAKRRGEVVKPAIGAPGAEYPRKPSLLFIVRLARSSARRSLDLIRGWAAVLRAEEKSFAIGRFKGLSRMTGEQIDQAVASATANVAALEERLRTDNATLKRTRERATKTKTIGIGFLLFAALVVAVGLVEKQWVVFGVGLAVFAISAIATISAINNSSSEIAAGGRQAANTGAQLREAESMHQELIDTQLQFATRVSDVQREVQVFCVAVNRFERAALYRLPFAPAVPRRRKQTTDMIRMDNEEAAAEGVQVDRDLLPSELADLMRDGSLPQAAHWLARRMRGGVPDVLSRSAAYFV